MRYLTTSLIALFFLLTVTASVHGEPEAPEAICTSTGSGNWSTAATWSGCRSGTPQPGDTVVIATGNTVTLDTNVTVSNATIGGILRFGGPTARMLTVTGNVTINSGGNLRARTTALTHSLIVSGNLVISGTLLGQNGNGLLNVSLGGDWTKSGTFTAGTNTVTFNGARVQTIGGSSVTAFNNLSITNGSRVVFPATAIPTVAGVMTVNPGAAVQQTQTVNNGTFNFLQISTSIYRGVDLITTNNLGSTIVVITTTVNGGCTATGTGSPAYATRCYEITPANNLSATVRLYALTATQLNGTTQANLRVYRYASGWQLLSTNALTGTATGGYSYAQATTPGFSDFLLGGTTSPTAVTLSGLRAATAPAEWIGPAAGLIVLMGAGILLKRHS
jgi:hypothetical protein